MGAGIICPFARFEGREPPGSELLFGLVGHPVPTWCLHCMGLYGTKLHQMRLAGQGESDAYGGHGTAWDCMGMHGPPLYCLIILWFQVRILVGPPH